MRKTSILIITLLTFGVAQAQIDFGPRGGLNFSKIAVDNISQSGDVLTAGDAITGWHAGLFFRAGVAGFYLQPELLFSFTGGEYLFTSSSQPSLDGLREIEVKRVDIPVLFGKKFAKVLRINAGPVASIVIDAKEIFLDQEFDLQDQYNSATIGFQAGVGVDLWKLIVDVKYEGSLSKLDDQIQRLNLMTDQRASQIVVSVGFKII